MLDISYIYVYNWFVDLGDWSNGMTRVSKTFSGGSIPSSPVLLGSRNVSFFIFKFYQSDKEKDRHLVIRRLPFSLSFIKQSKQNKCHNNNRQNICHICPHPRLNLNALTFVGFGNKIIPSPTSFAYTKKYKDKGTYRKN